MMGGTTHVLERSRGQGTHMHPAKPCPKWFPVAVKVIHGIQGTPPSTTARANACLDCLLETRSPSCASLEHLHVPCTILPESRVAC